MPDQKKKTTKTSKTGRQNKISKNPFVSSVPVNVATQIKTRANTTMSEQTNSNDNDTPSTSAIPDDTNIANTGVSRILSGYGHKHNQSVTQERGFSHPKFSGKSGVKFSDFKYTLKHYLQRFYAYQMITDDDATDMDKLFLFNLIQDCLVGQAFNIVARACELNNDGQLAYQTLCKTYEGNVVVQNFTVMEDFTQLKMKTNEDLIQFLLRVDGIKSEGDKNNLFPGEAGWMYYATLKALPKRFSTMKLNFQQVGSYPPWKDFKEQIITFDQLANNTTNPDSEPMEIMAVEEGTKPNIVKNPNKNAKKFIKKQNPMCKQCFATDHKSAECQSEAYCNFCNNRSHNIWDCNKKNANKNNFRGRNNSRNRPWNHRGFGNYDRGNHQQRGNNSNYRGNYRANYRGQGRGARRSNYAHRGQQYGQGRGNRHQQSYVNYDNRGNDRFEQNSVEFHSDHSSPPDHMFH